MKKSELKESIRMQQLADLLTESQIRRINEILEEDDEQQKNNLQVGNIVSLGDPDIGKGKIIKISDYSSNSNEIDQDIAETGWEASTPREELTWYKVKMFKYGDSFWYDEDELKSYN